MRVRASVETHFFFACPAGARTATVCAQRLERGELRDK